MTDNEYKRIVNIWNPQNYLKGKKNFSNIITYLTDGESVMLVQSQFKKEPPNVFTKSFHYSLAILNYQES